MFFLCKLDPFCRLYVFLCKGFLRFLSSVGISAHAFGVLVWFVADQSDDVLSLELERAQFDMWHAERGSRNDSGRAAAVAPFLVIELGEKNNSACF